MENVSIIIPVYNVEKYLCECLESVIGQTYRETEIICVDDGSTDNSIAIIEKYMIQDARIKKIAYEENKGVSYARNQGLKVAKGKYIYFLDSDDILIGNAIEDLVNAAEEYNTECIYFDSKLMMETEGIGSPNLQFDLPEYEKQVTSGTRLFQILMEHNVYTGSVCRQFWKIEYLKKYNLTFEEGFLGEDALFSIQAILHGNRMMLVNKQYHIYRRHGGSMSTNVTPRKAVSLFRIYCRILQMWANGGFEKDVAIAIESRAEQLLLQVKRLYMRNKKDIGLEDFTDELEKHLFKEILCDRKFSNIVIRDEMIRKIKESPIVVIYGAGSYAVDVVEALQEENVEISYLAVTTMHDNTSSINGIPVKEIKDLQELKKRMIVVIGTVKRYREDIKQILNRYKISNYVELD